MQTLRRAHFLARFVLAWFVMALGVAVAAPLVNPQAMELVCSAGGSIKLVNTGGEGDTAPSGHTLECPLCMVGNAPPPALPQAALQPPAQAHVLHTVAVTHIAGRSAAPLPPRGPPVLI